MSTDGGSAKTVGATYDIADLRGRMVVCFSLSELRQLAEDLGAIGIAWDRGASEAAREICKTFERRGDVGTLVARLKKMRPLVEWPELDPAASSVEPATSETYEPMPIPPPADDERDEDAEATVIRPADPIPEPIANTDQPAPHAPPDPPEPAETPAGPPITDPYATPGPSGGGWPGTVPVVQAKPEPRGLDPRILIAVTGLMVVAVGIAYLAGRVSNPPPASTTTPASAAPSPAPPERRPEGLATRAADAIGRRLESVARACEVQPGPAEEVMQRAVARCGRETIAAPPRTRPAPAPARTDAPPRPPAQAAPPRPRPVSVPAAPPAAENAACLGGCERQHKACKSSKCGREPTEGSKYAAYQDCLSKCLIEASRCRLSCQ